MKAEDLRISVFEISNENTIENVLFYDDKHTELGQPKAFHISEQRDQFGLLMSRKSKEVIVRVYVTDKEKVDEAKEAFKLYHEARVNTQS